MKSPSLHSQIISRAARVVPDDLLELARPALPYTAERKPAVADYSPPAERDATNLRQRVMATMREAISARINEILTQAVGGDLESKLDRMSKVPSCNGDLVMLDGKPLVWIGNAVPVMKGLEIGFTMEYRLV